LRKKVLIISQLRSKIFDTVDNDILFLNEGCKLYKNNKNYKYEILKNNEVLNYKITSLNKKFSYLLKIYENLLEELSIKLNKIHNTNYPVQSWRIIIGPWLFIFITIIFHNWKLLKYINNNYLIKRVYIAKFIFSKNFFNDFNDFAYSSQTDEFNNLIYSDLLKYFNKIKIKYFLKKKMEEKKKKFFFYFIFKFLNFLSLLSNFFLNRKIFIHEPYYSTVINLFSQIKTGQFPAFFTSPIFKNISLKKKFREQKFNYSHDTFLNILYDIIFKYMPVSYLENFNKYKKKTENIYWPKNPKIIFSSNSFFHDDFFKIWLAEKKRNSNTKFISGQHGGCFFTNKFDFYELHQKKISNQILTWGYQKNKIYKPMFNFKTAYKDIKFNSQGHLLMVDYELSRFPQSSLVYNNFSHYQHFNNKLKFIENLKENIKNKLIFRPYHQDMGWNTINRLKDVFKFIKIDNSKSIYVSLKNIRICVVNFNSTVFLETLNLNLPTVIYFDPKQDLIRNDAKFYFDALKKVNIYFDNSLTAAKHLNNIWNEVDRWWYDKKTQDIVNLFCKKFSRKIKKPINKLVYFFKNFKNND
jgi:putative transferase (TIGR04331 family)